MFSLNEQEEITYDVMMFLMSLSNDKIRDMKNKCQNFEFDNIDVAFQHSVLPENIIGQIKEFDDHTVHKNMVN